MIVFACLLNERILFIFSNEIIIELPDLSGVAPPHNPVFPPCGTIIILFSDANFNILDTSSVLDGLNTA